MIGAISNSKNVQFAAQQTSLKQLISQPHTTSVSQDQFTPQSLPASGVAGDQAPKKKGGFGKTLLWLVGLGLAGFGIYKFIKRGKGSSAVAQTSEQLKALVTAKKELGKDEFKALRINDNKTRINDLIKNNSNLTTVKNKDGVSVTLSDATKASLKARTEKLSKALSENKLDGITEETKTAYKTAKENVSKAEGEYTTFVKNKKNNTETSQVNNQKIQEDASSVG